MLTVWGSGIHCQAQGILPPPLQLFVALHGVQLRSLLHLFPNSLEVKVPRLKPGAPAPQLSPSGGTRMWATHDPR